MSVHRISLAGVWRRWRVAAVLLLVAALATGAVALVKALFPTEASYVLDAKTERLVLTIPEPGPRFGWSNLRLISADGKPAQCAVDALKLGAHRLTLTLTTGAGAGAGLDETNKPPVLGPTIVAIRTGQAAGDAAWPVPCKGGPPVLIRQRAVLGFGPSAPQAPTLVFFGNIEVGGLPDTQGSSSQLLQSGELRASGQVKGTGYAPAFNKMDLLPGDALRLTARAPAQGAASYGLIRITDDGFHVVAHAADAVATLERLGRGTPDVLEIMPGPLAVLQANPTWGVVSLACTALSGLLSLAGALLKSRFQPPLPPPR